MLFEVILLRKGNFLICLDHAVEVQGCSFCNGFAKFFRRELVRFVTSFPHDGVHRAVFQRNMHDSLYEPEGTFVVMIGVALQGVAVAFVARFFQFLDLSDLAAIFTSEIAESDGVEGAVVQTDGAFRRFPDRLDTGVDV